MSNTGYLTNVTLKKLIPEGAGFDSVFNEHEIDKSPGADLGLKSVLRRDLERRENQLHSKDHGLHFDFKSAKGFTKT